MPVMPVPPAKGVDNRILLSVLVERTKNEPNALYKLYVTSGETWEGKLSPFDDQSDYIRLIFSDGSGTIYVRWAEVVGVLELKSS